MDEPSFGWADAKVVTDVADTALNVLSFAAEVRAGLWRKNGQCMNDQVRKGARRSKSFGSVAFALL